MTKYSWTISTIPSHKNKVRKIVKYMNRFNNLPFLNFFAKYFKNKLIKELRDCTNIDFDCNFSILYGNISGNNIYLGNTKILDYAPVSFGDNVVCGDDVKIITSWHPKGDFDKVYAKPISIGKNTWLTMNIIVLAGVEIGENCIIGAGSVVTKSIPDNCFAAGNPCKVIENYNE